MSFRVSFQAWDTANDEYKTGDAANITPTLRVDGSDVTGLSVSEEGGGWYSVSPSDTELPEGSEFVLYGESSSADVLIIGSWGVRPEENIISHGDNNWGTATGFSTHSATDVRDSILDDATPFSGARINASIDSRAAPGDAMRLTEGTGTGELQLDSGAARANDRNGERLASKADVEAITVSSRIRISAPAQFERPDSGSTDYRIWIYHYDSQGLAEDLDENPSVAAENNTGDDRSTNLGTVTKETTPDGVYYVDYTVSDSHAIEGLVFKVDATEGGVETRYAADTVVVDTTAVDFTNDDRTKLEAVHGKLPSGEIADESTASAAKTAAESADGKLTSDRLGKLDRDLAHAGDAETYQATGFAEAGDAMALTGAERSALAELLLASDWREIDASPHAHSVMIALYALRYGMQSTESGIDVFGPEGSVAFSLGDVETDPNADPITKVAAWYDGIPSPGPLGHPLQRGY